MTKALLLRVKLCWVALRSLLTEGYTYRASALAFTTLLALVPLLSVVLFVISKFTVFTKFIELSQNYIVVNFIPTSRNVIEYYLESCIKQATALPAIGIFFLFIATGMLLITIEHTFDQIWKTSDNREKYVSWLIYWLVLLLAPVLIGLAIFISSYLLSLSFLLRMENFLGIEKTLLACVTVLINMMIFSIIYIAIPRCKVRWRDGIFSGFIVAILFEIAKIGFAFYIRQFHQYEVIYGVLAEIPIFLVWIYIIWLIILYGAIVTYMQYKHGDKKRTIN